MRVVIRIDVIAPPAPPCFESRDIWLQYLRSALVEQRDGRRFTGHPEQVVIKHDDSYEFNSAFNFCLDCTARHSLDMHRTGRCQPDYLTRRHAAELAARTGADAS